MIILGAVLLILSALIPVPPIVQTLAIVLLVIGVILFVLGGVGHPIAGRRYWY